MVDAHESVTEVDDDNGNGKEKGRRRRFGRGRKDDPKEVRSETEWVDTLVAHAEGEEAPVSGSPFAAGEEETETPDVPELPEAEEPTGEVGAELPADVHDVDDEYLIREKQLPRPEKLALENQVREGHPHKGERDAFYEKSWTRRQADSHDEIRNYIDNVLGTDLDRQRRERRGRASVGARRAAGQGAAPVHVEGLEGDILIAFTFPKEEFRSARVVYETEGGYVVEVTRAVGNDEARLETQYYTVSRVGEVGHVLDKMRAREAERRAREEGIEPVAPVARPETEPVPEPPAEPPAAEDVGAPGATEADKEPQEAVEEPRHEGAQAEEAEPEEEEGGKKKGFGLFKRKKGDEEEPAEGAPGSPAESEAPEAVQEEDGGKKKFGLFKRKKGEDEAEAESEEPAQVGEGITEEENQA